MIKPSFSRQCLFSSFSCCLFFANDSQARFNFEAPALLPLFVANRMSQVHKPLWFGSDAGIDKLASFLAGIDSIAVVIILPPEPLESGRYSETRLMPVPYETDDLLAERVVWNRTDKVIERSRTLPFPSPAKTQPETVYLTGGTSLATTLQPTLSPTSVPGNAGAASATELQTSAVTNDSGDQNNTQPPPGDGGEGADNQQNDEEESFRPVILYFDRSGGDGGDPGDPDDIGTGLQEPDEKEKAFKKLQERVRKVRSWQVKTKWRIIGDLIRFARQNRNYAVRCYQYDGAVNLLGIAGSQYRNEAGL